jgi:autotransporter adhesin
MGPAQAQVKIGTNPTTINPGSVLELESPDRGLLMSRVAITDRNTWGLNGNVPVEGMVVYNTTATTGVNGLQEGLVVWKNGQWISVDETPYFHVNSTAAGNSTLSNSGATGAESIAIGPGAVASNVNTVALGNGAQATGSNAMAVGANANATTTGAIAMGQGASVLAPATITPAINDGIGGVAIGQGATVRGGSASYPNTAVGYGASAGGAAGTGVSATAFGGLARADGTDSTAVGRSATASNNQATALGMSSTASGVASSATGVNSQATSNRASAYGYSSSATGNRATALGSHSSASGDYSTALGIEATASGTVSFAQGYLSNASGFGATAMGYSSTASAEAATALGVSASATQTNAVAVGRNASANVADGVALGSYSVASRGPGTAGYDPATGIGSTNTSSTWRSTLGAFSVGDPATNRTRQITGVAAGTADTDAVNVAQLLALQSNVNTNINIAANKWVTGSQTTTYVAPTATGIESTAVGSGSLASGPNSVAVGTGAAATTANSVALGNGSTTGTAVGVSGTTIQGNSYSFAGSNPTGVVSVGSAGNERQIQNVAAGQLSASSTDAVNGSQLYATNQAINNLSVTAGAGINVTTAQTGTGVAIGTSVANVGPGGTATYTAGNNVVLTQNGTNMTFAVNENPNFTSVTVGNTSITNNGVSIQGGPSLTTSGVDAGGKTITNVAAGVNGTDAVNLNQLNTATGNLQGQVNNLDNRITRLGKELSGGVAASAAMAVVTPVEPGRYHLTGAVAAYNGQVGIGFNVLKRSENGQTTLHAGLGWVPAEASPSHALASGFRSIDTGSAS